MKNKKSIYLDCEWFMNQEIFLIGYCYCEKSLRLLHGRTLTIRNVEKMLSGVDTIYFYGPDIAQIEKNFGIDLRSKYQCVNLLSMFRYYAPRLKSHKLAYLEKLAGIERETHRYKTNIWKLAQDWHNPKTKHRCLHYNAEDVINLLLVKKWFFKKYGLRKSHTLPFCL